ncbi:hypothetical protein BGZ95_001870 [Linnemannia exigua]|uniref:Uncharacterized protein n=1 Tax=Linnemannia exigua TaxID=604196 RepID=A0AAD4D6A0_9FUNG|nr:hypothetical protein BGZ95_001870 [Linnemannia exigua]
MSSSQQVQQAGQQHQATIRSIKSASATTSATIKQAEDNRRVEDAARTRRKIADLEISNSSLLSVNQSLEATIRKQASEIQELRIQMQSAQYGELGVTAADLALAQSVEAIELTEEEKQDDLTFKRLCQSIEHMIYEAKSALDQCSKPPGVKVLSLHDMYEKEIQEEEEEGDDDDEEDDENADNEYGREMSHMTFVQDGDEDEYADIGIGSKHSSMKTEYSIEVIAPQDDDPADRNVGKANNGGQQQERENRLKQQQHKQQQRSREPSSTRRDSGLSRSSGESLRSHKLQPDRDNSNGNGIVDEVNLDGSDREDNSDTRFTNSPHIMISSAGVLEAPTIVS